MKSVVSALWFSAPAGPNIARRTSRPSFQALPALFQSFFQCGRGFLPEIFFAGFAAFLTALANQSSRYVSVVMPGLVPGIHVFVLRGFFKTWMAWHQGVYARLQRASPGHDGILVSRRRFDPRPDVADGFDIPKLLCKSCSAR